MSAGALAVDLVGALQPLGVGRLEPAPDASSEELRAFYADGTDAIRAGLMLAMIGGAMTIPFIAVITCQMRRVEGQLGPLSLTQFGAGLLGVLLIVIPMMAMEGAAFRGDADTAVVRGTNDVAWLFFIGTIGLVIVQNTSIAVCVFCDAEERVFPRWVGYFNIWVAIGFIPGALIVFFKTGPFAWNGLMKVVFRKPQSPSESSLPTAGHQAWQRVSETAASMDRSAFRPGAHFWSNNCSLTAHRADQHWFSRARA